MNKEVVLALIYKDINELEVLCKGFSESDVISPTILGLAKTKAASVLSGLSGLDELKVTKSTQEPNPEIIPFGFSGLDTDLSSATRQNEAEILHDTIASPESESGDAAKGETIIPVAEFTNEIQSNQVHQNEVVSETSSANDIEAKQSPEEMPAHIADVTEETTASPEQKQSLAEILNTDGHSLNDTLAQKAALSLGNVLSGSKIEDLRQAVSLADRFRFQRELFQGNGEKFNTTLITLNSMRTEQEAMDYLSDFGWNDEDECVIQFKQLIHRKFA